MSREVDIDLYKVLEKSEIVASIEGEEADLIALIDFYKLQEFTNAVPGYFEYDPIEVEMDLEYIYINIKYIIEDFLCQNIESYRDAIGEPVYQEYMKFTMQKNREG